jgi:hypothetical protein
MPAKTPPTAPELHIPWTVRTEHSKIKVLLTIGVGAMEVPGVLVRVKTAVLVSAVASTSSDWCKVGKFSPSLMHRWRKAAPPIRTASVELEFTPTLPADRRIALLFPIRWDPTGDDYVSLPTRTFYIQSILICDVPDDLDS